MKLVSAARAWTLLALALVAADSVAVFAGYITAFGVRLAGPWRIEAPPAAGLYALYGALIVPVWLAGLAIRGTYRRRLLLGGPAEYGAVFNASLSSVAALGLLGFAWDGWRVSRLWLALGTVLAVVFLELGRFAVRRAGYALRRRGWFVHTAVVVGASLEGRAIAQQLNNPARTGVTVLGFLDDYLPVETEVLPGLPVLGRPVDQHGALRSHVADELVVVSQAVSWETLQTIIQHGSAARDAARIRIAAGFYELVASGVEMEERARVPLLAVNRTAIVGVYALAKSCMDVAFALVFGLPALLLAGVISAACRLSGIRKPWILHQRVGRGGKTFMTRTLDVEALRAADAARWFQWLARQPGVERLPAIWNLLRRDVSLIGPDASLLGGSTGTHAYRSSLLTVRPGLWSLSSPSLPVQDRVRLEMYYVRNFSIALDLQILTRRLLAWFLDLRPRPSDYAPLPRRQGVDSDLAQLFLSDFRSKTFDRVIGIALDSEAHLAGRL